jgi:hypothetical protein
MKKGWIIGGVCGVLFLALLSVGILAASVGKEASVMDALLKEDVKQNKSVAEVQKQLADNGYTVQEQAPKLKAVGPKHSIIVYSTNLTLEIGFDDAGKMHNYHLDRS